MQADLSNDEDSNVGLHKNVKFSVEKENEVAEILGEMQKMSEELQAKLDKSAAEDLLFFVDSCYMEALQVQSRQSRSE